MITCFEKIYNGKKADYLRNLSLSLQKKEKKFIVTINPETIVTSYNDDLVKKMLNDDNVDLVPDSIELLRMCNFLNVKKKERVPGIDIASFLLDEANEHSYSLYLFGAKENVIRKLSEVIKEKYPNIKLLGFCDGYVENKDDVMKKITKLKPDICLIGLGVPRQEKIIYEYFNDIKKGCYIGVGGALDVISGCKKRAPMFFLKLNLEWLYRITKEPYRLKRFFKYNIRFLFDCIILKVSGKNVKN